MAQLSDIAFTVSVAELLILAIMVIGSFITGYVTCWVSASKIRKENSRLRKKVKRLRQRPIGLRAQPTDTEDSDVKSEERSDLEAEIVSNSSASVSHSELPSLKELQELFKDDNHLRAKRLVEPHLGLSYTIEGKVERIDSSLGDAHVDVKGREENANYRENLSIVLWFGKSSEAGPDLTALERLRKGDEVFATGQLKYVSYNHVALEECVLFHQ